MPRTKDPYKVERSFLTSPTQSLYQDHDIEMSKANWIEDLIEDALDLDKRIEGDFNLDYLKFRIYNNEYSFVRTGLIAFKIKVFKLYKDKAKSFKKFCEDHLHKTHWMINRLIEAAKVVIDLIVAGFEILPRNEAQCRALKAHCEGDLAFAWQHVLDEHEGSIHKITAKSITRSLKGEEEEPKMQTLVVTAMLYAEIWKQAALVEMKPVQFLEQLFLGQENGDNFAQKIKERKWSDDLEDLIYEQENREDSA